MFRRLIIKVIIFYQRFLSPNLGTNCRFYPSCSQYSLLAIEKYGLLVGSWFAIKRILRCNPWFQGGVDLP